MLHDKDPTPGQAALHGHLGVVKELCRDLEQQNCGDPVILSLLLWQVERLNECRPSSNQISRQT